jgi:hypothetical protein
MSTYRQIKVLAITLVGEIWSRYKPAAPDEEPHALTSEEAIARVNTLAFCADRTLHEAAETLAATNLEGTKGMATRWVPRAAALSLDAEDDIETLAEIIAHKAIQGYEPTPYQIVKEVGENSNMLESAELVDAYVDSDAFLSDAIYQRVFDSACALLDEWNNNAGLWWPEEPGLPLDDPPPEDTETGKDVPL